MKPKLLVTIPKKSPWVYTACGLFALSAILRLWHYLPQKMDSFTLWVQLVMPVCAATVFLAGMALGGKNAKYAAITATVIGVAFFILKSTTFAPLHQTLCTILYTAVLVLFCGTMLGLFPTKKLLYPLFGLPLIYHILIEDTQAYFFADPPVPVWYWMPEISVLCIMAGLLCLSVSLKAEPFKIHIHASVLHSGGNNQQFP